MTDNRIMELTQAEIDAVSGGQVAVGNLVDVQVSNVANHTLNNLDIGVNVNALNSAPNAFNQA